MIQLDLTDNRPLYEQIKEKISELIIKKVLSKNEQLPSVRELSSILAINPNTIQRAYKDLEREGYIYSQQSKGSFVAPIEHTAKIAQTNDLIESLNNIILKLKYLGYEKDAINELVQEAFKGGTEN